MHIEAVVYMNLPGITNENTEQVWCKLNTGVNYSEMTCKPEG
jgi:hypothetical protein